EQVRRLREDTPGCREVIHFNNAGAALMPRPVIDATIDHVNLESRIGGYEAADAAEEVIEGAYDAVAGLIGAGRDESATVEYASNVISFLQVARRSGVTVEVVPNDEHGQMSVAALREMMDDRVRLIAVSHIPTNGGLIQPVAEIGKVAREAGVFYLVDACQS